MKKRWSVKEFYKLTDEEFESERERTPSGHGISTGGSTVHRPHATLFAAAQEMRRLRKRPQFGPSTQFKIVDHDQEMRRWGRHDFVDYPSEEDTPLAESVRRTVIPEIAPGESIEIRLGI